MTKCSVSQNKTRITGVAAVLLAAMCGWTQSKAAKDAKYLTDDSASGTNTTLSSFPPYRNPNPLRPTTDLDRQLAKAFSTRKTAAIAPVLTDMSLSNDTNPAAIIPNTSNGGSIYVRGGQVEPSVSGDPTNLGFISATSFVNITQGANNGPWPTNNSGIWTSNDGGQHWLFVPNLNPPIGVTDGGPDDQTVQFDRKGSLYGTFLTQSATNLTSIYSASLVDQSVAATNQWFVPPASATAQQTDLGFGQVDQPWLIVNPDPVSSTNDNVYVAHDDASVPPTIQVAVANNVGGTPPNVTINNSAAPLTGGLVNAGSRLAGDGNTGFIYLAYQQDLSPVSPGPPPHIVPPHTISYRLNRSRDAGTTWDFSSFQVTAAPVLSDQGDVASNNPSTNPEKFGSVNALLGGVDSIAVDPVQGDVYYVFGAQDVAGNNDLWITRIVTAGDAARTMTAGAPINLTAALPVNPGTGRWTALPRVAVATDGTIGVFYYSFDGLSSQLDSGLDSVTGVARNTPIPILSAHFTMSHDHGATFQDQVLLTFPSTEGADTDARQRVLGDFMGLQAVGQSFLGVFAANGTAFGRAVGMDPVFFGINLATSLSVPDKIAFPPTVIQADGPCGSAKHLPLLNNTQSNITITNVSISGPDAAAFSIEGLPAGSIPVTISPGDELGDGNLSVNFAPTDISPNRFLTAQVDVTIASGVAPGTKTYAIPLAGEAVQTGMRVLVSQAGVPVPVVSSIQVRSSTGGNVSYTLRNVPLSHVNGPLGFPELGFDYHAEFGAVTTPKQRLTGNWRINTTIKQGRRLLRSYGNFSLGTCSFNNTLTVNF